MTSAQSVVAQLVDMIRTGNWKAGDRLPTERALAETMGVGRSTIREALQNLAALNVIEATAGHGTVVKAPEPGEFFRADLLSLLISDTAANELLEARAMIEPDCAWLAARRGTEEDMAALAALLDEHQKAHDENRSVVPYGAGFHVQLARTAHNRVAVSFMESILDLLEERGKLADQLPGARTKELADHRYLFSLVSQRKADEARQAMLEHIVTWASSYDGTTGATLQDLWTT
ncbi:MAG: FadR family transcriptional regulator [Bauldia sp.]|nr:FadR family transcriptional regulator [Bauldia sp.]